MFYLYLIEKFEKYELPLIINHMFHSITISLWKVNRPYDLVIVDTVHAAALEVSHELNILMNCSYTVSIKISTENWPIQLNKLLYWWNWNCCSNFLILLFISFRFSWIRRTIWGNIPHTFLPLEINLILTSTGRLIMHST